VEPEWGESPLVPEETNQEEKACYKKEQQEQFNNSNMNIRRFLWLVIVVNT
jgi:hypothetical protein